MVVIDIEKKISDILFKKGYILSYEEKQPSSSEDMYEIKFYLNDNFTNNLYKTMYIRKAKNPKEKAFSMLLDEIIDNYYKDLN